MSAAGERFVCERTIDAAPYVLGALDEHDDYREHLESCATCAAEVARLQLAVDTLPTSVPQVAAPPQLRERVLATVRSEAELMQAASSPIDRTRRRPMSWRSRRVSMQGAAAALAAAVVLTLAVTTAIKVTAPEQVTVASLAGLAGAHASLHQINDHAELTVAGMPQPPLGKIYEVWLKRGSSAPQPTDALFGVNSHGAGAVAVPGDLHGVSEVLVTSEPLGGSLRPTSTPVLHVDLST